MQFPSFPSFFLRYSLIVLASAAAAFASPAQRPNVLIVLIDDHPFNFTDVYQKSHVATPNLQRLAARGTWFSNAYNDAPICCASRTALLTGVHSTRSGVYYNNGGDPNGQGTPGPFHLWPRQPQPA